MDQQNEASIEVIGYPALRFTEQYTSEFIRFSSTLSKKHFDTWASSIGKEISRTFKNDPLQGGNDYVQKLKSEK